MLTDEHLARSRLIDRDDSFDHIQEYIDALVLTEARLALCACWRGQRRPTPPPADRLFQNAWHRLLLQSLRRGRFHTVSARTSRSAAILGVRAFPRLDDRLPSTAGTALRRVETADS
jgi:hypothetical protein